MGILVKKSKTDYISENTKDLIAKGLSQKEAIFQSQQAWKQLKLKASVCVYEGEEEYLMLL